MAGYLSKPVNKGGSSGHSNGGSVKHANIFLTPSLYAMAKKLPPNERVKIEAVQPRKIYQRHLSDEQAMEVIRKRMDGVKYKELAEITGFSVGSLRAICTGQNRPHLLRMVEEGYTEPMMGYRRVK